MAAVTMERADTPVVLDHVTHLVQTLLPATDVPQRADRALYEGKSTGKNRVVIAG